MLSIDYVFKYSVSLMLREIERASNSLWLVYKIIDNHSRLRLSPGSFKLKRGTLLPLEAANRGVL